MLVSLLTPSAIGSAAFLGWHFYPHTLYFSAEMFVVNSPSAFESLKLVNRSPCTAVEDNCLNTAIDLAVSQL
jgi:hypothetical protein